MLYLNGTLQDAISFHFYKKSLGKSFVVMVANVKVSLYLLRTLVMFSCVLSLSNMLTWGSCGAPNLC